MTETEYLLTVLGEECNETAQRISKALRFSLEEIQEGQNLTNAQRIIYEFNDIVATMEVLHERGLLQNVMDREALQAKKQKISKWLEYSKSIGTVQSKTTNPK